jgi:hypothetical protein
MSTITKLNPATREQRKQRASMLNFFRSVANPSTVGGRICIRLHDWLNRIVHDPRYSGLSKQETFKRILGEYAAARNAAEAQPAPENE